MRLRDNSYECALCGVRLDIDENLVPLVVIHASSGHANERVISVRGTEIHRCRIEPQAPPV